MSDIPKDAIELLMATKHIKEITTHTAEHMRAGQFQEVDISLIFKPDFVPDLTKLASGIKDTMVATIKVEVRKRDENADLSNVQDKIDAMHNRTVMVGGLLKQGTVPITFTEKKSETESVEYFQTYKWVDHGEGTDYRTNIAAGDIWSFLIRGSKPVMKTLEESQARKSPPN